MIGAIITLSIIAFVSLCLNAVLFILNRSSLRMVSWIEDWGKAYSHLIERLTNTIEGVEDYLNQDKIEKS